MADLADTSGMSLADAAAYIRNHAQPYRALLTIVDRLDDVAKIDAQVAETEKTLAAKRDELAKVTADIDAAQQKLDDANGGIDDAKQTATEIVAKANKKADGIIAKAEADAQSAADAVALTATNKLAVTQSKIVAAQSDLDTLNADIATARDTLASLEADAVAAKAEAQKARDFIASLKG